MRTNVNDFNILKVIKHKIFRDQNEIWKKNQITFYLALTMSNFIYNEDCFIYTTQKSIAAPDIFHTDSKSK